MNKLRNIYILISIALILISGGVGFLIGKATNVSESHSNIKNTSASKPQKKVTNSNSAAILNPNLSNTLSALKSKYPTIQDSYVYTTDRDPNDDLGKAGEYIAGAEFYDTRTNTEPDGTAFGADSGGSIEVYSTVENATTRYTYLKSFQGDGALNTGAISQVNNIVLRASAQYDATDQADMISSLTSLFKTDD